MDLLDHTENHEKFNNQLLDRLRCDCEYYLGFGNRNKKHLWALDEEDHIASMKELYNKIPENKKPEWLKYEDILEYEKQMIRR